MPGRPYILAETTWKEVESTDYEVVVLPWGATEAHNYHLPYITDVVQCDRIAAEAARLGMDAAMSWSCYDPTPEGLHCGACDSCRLRSKGFADAGLPDPTHYA